MSNDDFGDKLDKAVNNYDKGMEKLAPKLENAVEKVGRGLNRVYIGCTMIFGNLFFAAFCLWGAYYAVVSWRLQTSGEITTGTVIRLEESTHEGSCCVYSPVVEFQVDGQTYSFENDNASSSPDYQVGGEVEVRYDPADPNTAQINTFSNRWLVPIILIPVMILSSLIFSFFLIRAWRRDEDVIGESFN